jgi:hypothetical protein
MRVGPSVSKAQYDAIKGLVIQVEGFPSRQGDLPAPVDRRGVRQQREPKSYKYGTARMPLPGIASVVGAAATVVVALIAGNVAAGVLASIGLACLGLWLVLFNRISLPINKILIAAVDAGETPANARALQEKWDSIINVRAVLQGFALLAFCLTLAVGAQ